jgi:hypothetical protein
MHDGRYNVAAPSFNNSAVIIGFLLLFLNW